MNLGIVVAAALAASAQGPSATVLLKAAAADPSTCRATPMDDQLVRVALFSREAEECPVAVVGDETIPLRELAAALELGHLSRSPRRASPASRPEMDFTPALDRLIAARLLAQEAREVLGDVPELRAQIDEFRASRLRAMLQRIAARGVKPDAVEVERLYRDAVREWKISSVLLDKEEDAKSFVGALRAGGRFEALARKSVAEKKGRGDGKAQFVSRRHMLPEILAAVQGAKRGDPVGPVRLSSGWVVLRLDGTRYPKDEAARAEARARSAARLEREAIRRFYLSLVKKHAVVDEALLKQLDFEVNGEKGFLELAKDERPLATIGGDKPLTVADLTREIATNFFHGIAGPIGQHRVNPHKQEAFERLLGSRLFAREAAVRKLVTRPELLRQVEERERALLFGAFVEKVIAPDVKVMEDEVLGAYERDKARYTAPEMYKLDGFAFADAREAQAALEKLKAGTDFAWLRSNAAGQVPPERRSLQLDGRTVSVTTLPRDLASALAGARSGEYRLYAANQAEVYVIRVVEHVPPTTQPYAEAREAIARKLFDEKLARAVGEYADKLRKAQRVDVLIARVSL
jgi:parvulin-like peptidyl-prolyl isomerase